MQSSDRTKLLRDSTSRVHIYRLRHRDERFVDKNNRTSLTIGKSCKTTSAKRLENIAQPSNHRNHICNVSFTLPEWLFVTAKSGRRTQADSGASIRLMKTRSEWRLGPARRGSTGTSSQFGFVSRRRCARGASASAAGSDLSLDYGR